jgi:hypothetical protein
VTTFSIHTPSFWGHTHDTLTHYIHWWRAYILYFVFKRECVFMSWVELLLSNEWWTIKRESSSKPLWGEWDRIPFSLPPKLPDFMAKSTRKLYFFSVLGNLYSHGASHFCNYSRQYKILYLCLFNPLLPQNYT